MTTEERAVLIVSLFGSAVEHALAGELDEAIEVGTEAVVLASQARDDHKQSFLPGRDS